MTEHAKFVQSFKSGDKVAIFEGYVDDNTLPDTDVTITEEVYKKCCDVLKPILGD